MERDMICARPSILAFTEYCVTFTFALLAHPEDKLMILILEATTPQTSCYVASFEQFMASVASGMGNWDMIS